MLIPATNLNNYIIKAVLPILVFVSTFLIFSNFAMAGCTNPTSTREAVQCGASPGQTGTPQTTIETTITNIINLLSVLVGVASVIAIIIAGFMFVTAAGDGNRTARARTAVIFALVGLILVGLAQAIVNFVVERTV